MCVDTLFSLALEACENVSVEDMQTCDSTRGNSVLYTLNSYFHKTFFFPLSLLSSSHQSLDFYEKENII